MAFLAHYSNSTIDFGLHRHIKSIPRGTGNLKCRPSTILNHCALDGRNTKKLKNQKLKLLIFLQTLIFQSNFFKKSQNNEITFYEKFKKKQCYFGF